MGAQHNLARLRVEDPAAAAAVVNALWEQLAREEPRMFAALWRRANKESRRPAPPVPLIPVQWIEELPPLETVPALPAVNLSLDRDVEEVPVEVPAQEVPAPEPSRLVFQPSPTLADLLPAGNSVAS